MMNGCKLDVVGRTVNTDESSKKNTVKFAVMLIQFSPGGAGWNAAYNGSVLRLNYAEINETCIDTNMQNM